MSKADASGGNAAELVTVLSQKDLTFLVLPPEIKFKGFQPHSKYEATLRFKNQTKVAQYIRLMQPESRFFSISEPRGGTNSLKVAAGLSICYVIYFNPEQDGDYDCDLVAFTEHERFIVPVRAIGSRGVLSIPELVNFDAVPVKSTTQSTILVSNVGTKACEWKALVAAPFSVQPTFGRVEAGSSTQVTIEFTPTALMHFESTIVFDLGGSITQSMKVSGYCEDIDINLSSDTIVIPKTFIGLERQGVIKVFNRSDVSVQFCWKQHRTDEEETAARRDVVSLARKASQADATTSVSAQRQLKSKLELLEVQTMIFDDDVFTIQPVDGMILAKGIREFVITFNPQLAMSYCVTAYLDIQGRHTRLPMTIKGLGLGPHCGLSFDSLDLGDIFINSTHQYEVVLENRGSIEAKWALQPQVSLFGPKFKFSPSSGAVAAGTIQAIDIQFCSDLIGIVSETFRIHVQGSGDELHLHFKGRVIGPTFHFDVEELDFGNVSYNFWHMKNFNLVNTSEIPMKFVLRVPEDNVTGKEFDVIPSTGTILPHGKQKIQVDFLSNTVQEYNAHLVVDIDEVGDNLDSLPIKATCMVPDVMVSRDSLDYGQCFIGFPYPLELEIRNETPLSVKYEVVLPSDDDPIRKKANIIIGNGDIRERKGVVAARSSQVLITTLTAKMTGNVHVPLYIRILGSERAPHHVALSAKVTGPKVEVVPKILDFGTVEVLKELSKPVVLVNSCPIPATYCAKLTSKHPSGVVPPFSLKVMEGVVKPNSTTPLHITAFLDEAMKFTDVLSVTVQHNPDVETVQLTGKGKGFTLVPSVPLDLVDFEDVFTTIAVKKSFTLYNKGRRPQQIQWQNERGKLKEGDPAVVFTINPERATLNGKSEETFTIDGLSEVKGIFSEKFSCKLCQSHKNVLIATIQGNFQPPLLQYSSSSLQFMYTYDSDIDESGFILSKPLTLKNISPLALDFSLKVSKGTGSLEFSPFVVDQSEFSLKKGESAVVNITFDASYRQDRVTHKTNAKLTVNYANHGQKDNVNLSAEMNFPNIQLDPVGVDFGCILNDTEQKRTLMITNPSLVPALYTWVFEEDSSQVTDSARHGKSLLSQPPVGDNRVPLNNVFDIIPFRGKIAPGTTEKVEVLFNAIPGRKFLATAVCQVEGGPDYPVQIIGEAGSIHYRFDKVVLDFGSLEYDKWEEKEIVLINSGRVEFPFLVDLSILSRPGMIEVSPTSGMLKDKVKILVRFSPRVPDKVIDFFNVQVAHFEPQRISVKGNGLYSSICISGAGYVSRNDPPSFKTYLVHAKVAVDNTEVFHPAASLKSKTHTDTNIDLVQCEAERMYFRDIITDDALMLKSVAVGEATELSDKAALIKRTVASGEVKYILSRYVVELGHIVRGETRKRSFKVTNSSTNPLMFNVDRRMLANSPISLSPDKFPKLSAYGSLMIEVTFDSKGKGVGVGKYSYELVLDIKCGPLVLVEFRAVVVVPQLELSTSAIEFGSVLVGMTRKVPVVIENRQSLPCEWQALFIPQVDPKDRRKGIDKRPKFICEPEKGVLQPQQKDVVHVSYIPYMVENIAARLHIKSNANPKPAEVSLTATGEEIIVEVEPKALNLESVFPFQTSRQTFQLINKSTVPVEVFSYDFDPLYLVEEEILMNCTDLFQNDVLLLPPREPGSSLPDNLMEAYYDKLQKEDDVFCSKELVPTDDSNRVVNAVESEKPIIQPSVAMPNLEVVNEEPEPVKQFVVVLVGPSLSGKSTQAALLRARYGFATLNLDAAVCDIMETDTIEGTTFRTLMSRVPVVTVPAVSAKISSTASTPAPGGKMEPSENYTSNTSLEISVSNLAAVIKNRLKKPDAKFGVVLDDLGCCITRNAETILLALKDACATMKMTLCIVDLAVDEVLMKLRAARIEERTFSTAVDATSISPLTDDAYDRMDIAGKLQHDLALKKFREAKKAHQKASERSQMIETQRARISSIFTIQEEADKDSMVVKEIEDPKAKKSAGQSKKKVDAAPESTPVVNWDEISGVERFKKLYNLLKLTCDDQCHKVFKTEQPEDESLNCITEQFQLPSQEEASARLRATVRKEPVAEFVISAPATYLRIEKIPEKRTVKPIRYFRLLTPAIREITSATPLPPKSVKPPAKGAAAPVIPSSPQMQSVLEEQSRWIIQPGQVVALTLQFCSDIVSAHNVSLNFGVVGTRLEIPLVCQIASSYPDVVRDLRTVFSKKKTKDSHSFSAQKKLFDFGPLLAPPGATTVVPPPTGGKKDPKGAAKPVEKVPVPTEVSFKLTTSYNSKKLTFSNASAFTSIMVFAWENAQDHTFSVNPETITLEAGQSGEVTVQATPDTVGEIKNSLVACIKDNPDPIKVDFSCRGTRPQVSLNGLKDCSVDFGKLLLKKQEARVVTIKNESALPLCWKLIGTEKLPQEILINITSGQLIVGADLAIEITFLSERANAFNIPLKVDVSDLDGLALYETLPLNVKAEAHDIVLEWTKEIDFKTIRATESKKEVVKMVNKGPYEIAYMFRLPKKLQGFLTIQPQEGTLRGVGQGSKDAPIVTVEVQFKPSKEVNIGAKSFGDIELSFFDPIAKHLVYPQQYIRVKGEALFNKFVIRPTNINFGPCLFKQKKQATFDIQNVGAFEIKYRLFNLKEGVAKSLETPVEVVDPKKKAADKKPVKKGTEAEVAEFQLGSFAVNPFAGAIAVGATQTISVSILPEGNAHFFSTLGILIEDRDLTMNPDGIPFEVEAESVVPGILCDLDSTESDTIFEEQQIVARLEGFKKMGSCFSREERAFSFGTVLAGRRMAERFRITNPNKVACVVSVTIAPRGDAPDAKTQAESFDLLELKPENGKCSVPPHEHRYVTVGFTPSSLNMFTAIFEAVVEGGQDHKTGKLRFELRGDGSLPNLVLDVPPPPQKALDVAQPVEIKPVKGKALASSKSLKNVVAVEEEKVPPNSLVMQRTVVGSSSSRSITLRNAGDLAATVKFQFPSQKNVCFSFPRRNVDIVLLPGAVEKFSVFFEPTTTKDFTAKLQMAVQDNRYEDCIVNIVGEGYHDDLTLAELDENTENRLSLGDCFPGEAKKRTISLVSHSKNALKFSWTMANSSISCVPKVGHIPPHGTKRIEVGFVGTTNSTEMVKCAVSYQAIDFAPDVKIFDWDETRTAVKWVADSALSAVTDDDCTSVSSIRRPLMKTTEPVSEPQYSAITGVTPGVKDLVVQYTCDMTSWDTLFHEPLSNNVVQFAPTKLFQQRHFTFNIKNTGKVRLPFSFAVQAAGESVDSTPFVVSPSEGSVAPTQSQLITVSFKPAAVQEFEHLLVGTMPYSTKPPLQLQLKGRSECPLVHFEIPQSDYLLNRGGDLPNVDQKSCIVEFHSRGIKIRNTVRFIALNPTNLSYEYQWVELTAVEGGSVSPFKCNTAKGVIHSGKQTEMVFEYLPETIKLKESCWAINILSGGGVTSIPFLLVGEASEPDVYFSQTKIQCGQIMVGAKSKHVVCVENRETVPYPFQFTKLASSSCITITPESGVVGPNASLPIEVIFAPTSEETYNCTLQCKVKKATNPLTCNVKGEGFTTHAALRLQDPDGLTTILSTTNQNSVNFGVVQVNGRISKKFIMSNQGRFNIDYKWIVPESPHISFSNMIGTVLPAKDSVIEVTYSPTKEEKLNDLRVICQIMNGNSYTVNLTAVGVNPTVTFSHKEIDFGACYVQQQGAEIVTQILSVLNKDLTSCAVDVVMEQTDCLEIDVTSFVLQPNEKRDIKVSFKPRDVIEYRDTLTFSINSLTTIPVTVKGEGTLPKVEVLNKLVRFGTLRVGESRSMDVKVQNKSKIPTCISLADGSLSAELRKVGVTCEFPKIIFLKPKEIKSIVFSFLPTARLRGFSEDVKFLVQDKLVPLATISGSCQGSEVHLNNKVLQFGQIVVGTRVTKKIIIMNTGDLGLDFTWNDKKIAPDFIINPAAGFVAAHTDLVCEVTYHPTEIGKEGKKDNIEIKFNDAPPLSFSIASAICVDRPSLTDIVTFSCRVRETQTLKLPVKNDSPEPWSIRPNIENSVFSGPESITVRPHETAEYPVTYSPMIITKNRPSAAIDTGTVFFPLPSGKALLFRLDGSSDAPAVSGPPVEREVLAKTPHVEKLVVSNWLKVPQRFTVNHNWAHDPKDESVAIRGVSTIDVPPNATREYKLSFSACKEGRYTGTIHFTNDQSKEYQFYNLAFKVKPAKEISGLDLRTSVRCRSSKQASISNPLDKPVVLSVKCDNAEVLLPPTVTIAPKSDGFLTAEFFPLLPRDNYPPAKLILSCPELGEFPFVVTLAATNPPPERPVRMSCALGQSCSATLRFLHYSKVAAEFAVKFQDPKQTSFTKSTAGGVKVNPCVDQKVGVEATFDISYEPGKVGEIKETVEVSSTIGGTYIFPLQATCLPPQRQGPIEIRPNGTCQIPFKNVFNENVNFTFVSDSSLFLVGKPFEAVQAKKPTSISVQYKCEDPNVVVRGKLTISGTAASEGVPTTWIFYLRGMKESEAVDKAPPVPDKKGKK